VEKAVNIWSECLLILDKDTFLFENLFVALVNVQAEEDCAGGDLRG